MYRLYSVQTVQCTLRTDVSSGRTRVTFDVTGAAAAATAQVSSCSSLAITTEHRAYQWSLSPPWNIYFMFVFVKIYLYKIHFICLFIYLFVA